MTSSSPGKSSETQGSRVRERHRAAAARRRERWALLGIVLGAVALRAIGLGHLSLAGDEETTALAALALLEGWPPTLPGGLVYVRGLPFTALEAMAVALFGVHEAALRAVPALLAAPRVAALWWLARPFLGGRLALVAAACLALAPLDIEHSRNARMYSMFATLDLIAIAAALHTALGARRAGAAVGCAALAVATHVLAVTHAVVPWVAALGRGVGAARRAVLVGIGLASAAAFLGFRTLSRWSYASVGNLRDGGAADPGPLAEHLSALAGIAGDPDGALLPALGVAGALAFSALGAPRLTSAGARWCAAGALLAFVAASPVMGALALLAAFAFEGLPLAAAPRRAWPHLLAGFCASAGWGLAAVASRGDWAPGLEAAARLLLGFPAPNWFEMALAGPLLFGLAVVGALVACDRAARGEQPGVWLALVAAAFAPALLTGLMERAGALRFQVHAVGPMIVLALLAASALAARLRVAPGVGLALAALLVGAAVRPDHGLRVVLREHGPVDGPYVQRVQADHRGAAAFVRAHAAPEDWIAAEDALQQHLLIGRTELWLRRFEDAAAFLTVRAEGEPPSDIYTGSRHVGDLAALRALTRAEGRRVVWLVTSGECERRPDWYRTPETDRLLRAWRPNAWFVGADGMTRVFRLENGEPVAPRRVGASRGAHAG